MSMVLRLEYAETPDQLKTGPTVLQLHTDLRQALRLADELKRFAERLLAKSSRGQGRVN